MNASAKPEQFPARELFVVEFQTFEGWCPMPGDAYLDESEAVRVSKRCDLPTRVVRYVPAVVPS